MHLPNVAASFVLLSQILYRTNCPSNSDTSYHVMDFTDCKSFYVCENQEFRAFNCPDGFLFDESLHGCNNPSVVKCDKTEFLKNKRPLRKARLSTESLSSEDLQRQDISALKIPVFYK
ncbi:hypothetical protein TNIN_199521 [Trichonephila inaurata madagascariensis]|uniref:Chitin-binding type-2 domain-containing protein n=1 Tax=Trichonephila inaurata madagascariensis TaxID=2747483 RepID=A0A8X7BMX0_9ARAC|nr:hypothetical protein TNIN_199521 [Trichonephila inaurata madagascariensis]